MLYVKTKWHTGFINEQNCAKSSHNCDIFDAKALWIEYGMLLLNRTCL